MNHHTFGQTTGKPVIYFHGTPGSPKEGPFFEEGAEKQNLCFHAIDRLSIPTTVTGPDFFDALAAETRRIAGHEKVGIVGFSMGCHVALEVAHRLKDQVSGLHLVSAAAPFDVPSAERDLFLSEAAGGAIFKLAMDRPQLFRFLSRFQSLLALVAPGLLLRMLFSSAQSGDAPLSATSDFQTLMKSVLKEGFSSSAQGYIRDIQHYVAPWSTLLTDIGAPTYLWHGSEDNWSPPAMVHYLNNTIPTVQQVKWFEGKSHYSCLVEATSDICITLAKDHISEHVKN